MQWQLPVHFAQPAPCPQPQPAARLPIETAPPTAVLGPLAQHSAVAATP